MRFGQRVEGDAGGAGYQRQAFDADEVFFEDGCGQLACALLLQVHEAPIGFHLPLEVGVGSVGGVEIAQGGEEFGIALPEERLGGDQLYLDMVGIS